MNLSVFQLIGYAARHGIHLLAVADELRLSGNREAVTPGFIQAVRAIKTDLLRVLAERPRPPTEAETRELAALVLALFADETLAERDESLGMALCDVEAALQTYRSAGMERGCI